MALLPNVTLAIRRRNHWAGRSSAAQGSRSFLRVSDGSPNVGVGAAQLPARGVDAWRVRGILRSGPIHRTGAAARTEQQRRHEDVQLARQAMREQTAGELRAAF